MSSLYQNSSTSADKDARLQQLSEWLASTGLVEVETGRPASADASFRRYFRYDVVPAMREKLGATLVAMDAPPERENVPAFIHVQGLLMQPLPGLTDPVRLGKLVDPVKLLSQRNEH